MNKTIGVVGLWHLGCVLCAAWYKQGYQVIGFDRDASRVEKLDQGEPPLYEPHLTETIKEGQKKKALTFSSDLNALQTCDYIFLAYDTPVCDDDSSDTSILEKSVAEISVIMKDGGVLIISSQSPVGLCDALRLVLKEKNSSLELAYSPENLRLGEAINCYLHPDRIVLGVADQATQKKCEELFAPMGAPILTMNLASAEMVKHGINSFLANSIVFTNHLKDVCDLSGALLKDVVRGMKSDPRIGLQSYLSPGIGFSGGTLGRDLKVLDAKNTSAQGDATLFGLIHQLNQERKYAIVRLVEESLSRFNGKQVGVLGLTYKAGTSTLRRSLPLEIVQLLIDKSLSVKAYDPKADYSELADDPGFSISKSIEEAADASDILILLTDWEDFKVYDWGKIPKIMHKPVFFDAKECLDAKKMTSWGFEYITAGKQISA